MQEFDVVIIGSGIGGLVSAGLLAAQGVKTLLLERHSRPGGYLASFMRKGYLFDVAVDCIAGVGPGGVIRSTLELLKVQERISFVRVDPIRVSVFPDAEVPVDSDITAYRERLTRLFPHERSGIAALFAVMEEAYGGVQAYLDSLGSGGLKMTAFPQGMLKLMGCSYAELLDEHLDDHRLKAILSDRCPFIGLPPSQVSALAMVSLMMSYFSLGAHRPVGGFQRLADVLIEGITRAGGTVAMNSGAAAILLDDRGLCRGVRCEDGAEYSCRFVISNADFGHTFRDLIGGRYRSFAEELLQEPGPSTSFFVAYLGLRSEIGLHSSVGYYPSYDMEGFFRPGSAFAEASTIGITVASREDPSRAPEGGATVVLHEMLEESDDALDKDACISRMLRKARRLIPGIDARIEVAEAATPRTFHRYTGNSRGSAFGWRRLPGFMGPRRHGIPNLAVAGHWGDVGGGVLGAAYSGAKAAADALSREGVRKRV